jgi:hypothetical protein
VSFLKKEIGQHVTPLEVLPPLDEKGKLVLIPEEILEVREEAQEEKHQRVSDQMEGFTH